MISPFLGHEPTIFIHQGVWLVVALGLLAGALLAWKRPTWALASVLTVAPLYEVRGNIGIPTTFLELYLLTILVVIAVVHLWPRRHCKGWLAAAPGRIGWALLVWTAAALSAALITDNRQEALGLWRAFYLEPTAWFLAARLMYRGHSPRPLLIGAAGALGLIMVWSLYLLIDGRGLAYDNRLLGPYQSANFMALFAGPLVILLVVWPERWQRLVRWVLAGAVLVMLAIANSRGGQLGLAVGALAVLPWLRGRLLKQALLGLAVVGILAAAVLGPRLVRHGDPAAAFSSDRQFIWPLAVEWVKADPLYPMAPGTFQDRVRDRYQDDNYGRQFITPFAPNAHNLGLVTWTEWGLPTLLALLAVLLVALQRLRQRLSFWQLVPAALLTATLAHGIVDTPVLKNDLALIFMLTLLLIEIVPIAKTRRLG